MCSCTCTYCCCSCVNLHRFHCWRATFLFHLRYPLSLRSATQTSPCVEKVPPNIIPIQSRALRVNSFLFESGRKNMKFEFSVIFPFFTLWSLCDRSLCVRRKIKDDCSSSRVHKRTFSSLISRPVQREPAGLALALRLCVCAPMCARVYSGSPSAFEWSRQQQQGAAAKLPRKCESSLVLARSPHTRQIRRN